MNRKLKIFTISFAALLIGILAACEKDQSDSDFGNNYVYMPQALISALRFNVPAGNDVSNYNYTVDDSKVNIRLGVLRSGKSEAESYTVSVKANPDTVVTMINNKVFDATTTVVMPASMYTLPQTVTVADGQLGTGFLLVLDKAQVKSYAGKKLALGVVISNSTKYTINPKINKVVVVVDVNALKLP